MFLGPLKIPGNKCAFMNSILQTPVLHSPLVVTVGHYTRYPRDRWGMWVEKGKMKKLSSLSVFHFFSFEELFLSWLETRLFPIALLDFDFCLCDFTSSLTPSSTPLCIICTSVDCLDLEGAERIIPRNV
ncbi:hypothetical protein CEXT_407321 [Caerostris extrusa]|uniref:Uncharacterized protein n=1 Tax=Caerostris extrusa TaxID=172846 RepID=A0AAV4T3H2_CAEEX|nr:hypothetical protein CEXT_407321 [Caerostris extrusa]